jgi:hypothetical protein
LGSKTLDGDMNDPALVSARELHREDTHAPGPVVVISRRWTSRPIAPPAWLVLCTRQPSSSRDIEMEAEPIVVPFSMT